MARILCGVMLCCLCIGAWALTPNEVLVVANTNSAESLQLATHYLNGRHIPRGNLCRVATATGYYCTRAEYETQIRVPVREYLVKHHLTGTIRCIALMWGVPVHILWQPYSTAYPDMEQVYEQSGNAALQRLACLEQWLNTVGQTFPAPKGDDLTRPELFFETTPDVSQVHLPKLDDHTSPEAYTARPEALSKALVTVMHLVGTKRQEVAKLTDPAQRAIADRQLLAVDVALNGRFRMLTAPAGTDAAAFERSRAEWQEKATALQEEMRWHPDAATLRRQLEAIAITTGLSGIANAFTMEMMPSMYRDAAVDNELALLWYGNYPLGGMRMNPLFHQQRPEPPPPAGVLPKDVAWPAVYLTARIDGPTAADAQRIIDDSLAVENVGLTGTVYLDAGGKYPSYDFHYKNLADFITKNTKLKVVLDEKPTLFPPGSCPDTALYTGWYHLRTYEPAFTWNKGSVGFHLASFEAADLRNPQATDWCVKIIQNGAAATLGPVSEPYLSAFPLPEEFFALLLTGKYTIVECYWRTLPNASWQMTLIADPLYTPYKMNPQVTLEQLPPGLAINSQQESSKAERK